MNDRIEELIVSYLHRGSTPEQERELFEACKNNSEVAALLRRHVTMSLKLRRRLRPNHLATMERL